MFKEIRVAQALALCEVDRWDSNVIVETNDVSEQTSKLVLTLES